MQADIPHHRSGPPRRAEGDGTGRRQSGRTGEGAFRILLPGDVQGHLPAAGRSAQSVCRARVDHRGRLQLAQPDAQFPCLPGMDRHRSLRRRLHPPTGRQAETRRYSGRSAREGHRRAGQQVFPQGPRHPGRLSHGDALCRSARGPAARPVPPELRLHAPDRGPRPCRRGRLLRTLRRAEDLQRDPGRRAAAAAAVHGLDVLLLRMRLHGLDEDLPARARPSSTRTATTRAARACCFPELCCAS